MNPARISHTGAFRIPSAAWPLLLLLPASTYAQAILRNNVAANLDLVDAWTGGVVPTSANIATWNLNSVGGAQTLAAAAEWGGIFIGADTPSSVTLNGAGFSLKLGASGINLAGGASTTRGLTLATTLPVVIDAAQTWALGEGSSTAANITAAGSISGAGGLNLTRSATGLGYFQFNGANTFSGGVTIGSNARVLLGANSVVSGTTPSSGPLGTGNLVVQAGSILASSSTGGRDIHIGNAQFAGDFTVGQPTTNTGRVRFNGNIDLLGATRTITLGATATGTGASVGFTALGSITTTNISNGTLRFVGLAPWSPVQFSAANSAFFTNNAGLVLGANTTTILGSGTVFGSAVDKFPNLTVEAGGELNLSDRAANSRNLSVASLDGAGTVTNGATSAGTAILTVNGTAGTALSRTFSGSITDGALGKVGLTKTGATTQTLSGPNSYTGATTVTAGTLALSGSGTLGNSAVTVNGGTLSLGGTTSSIQSLTVSSGAVQNGTLSTSSGVTISGGSVTGLTFGGAGGLTKNDSGTLTLAGTNTYAGATAINAGTLVLSGSLTSTINLGAATLSGEGSTTGALNAAAGSQLVFDPATPGALSVGSVSVPSGSLTVTPANGTAGSGVVILQSVADLPSVSSFNLPSRGTLALSPDLKQLLATLPAPGDITLRWVGADATNPTFWDANVTANFADGASSSKFFSGDNALFDDTATAFSVAIQAPGVSPTLTTFDNSLNDYSVSGGPISGSGALAKAGSAQVVLSGNHTYSGGTTISAGTLSMGAGGTTGSLGSGAVVNNGTLVLNRSNAVAQGTDFGALSGSGSIQKTGTGNLTLGSANTFTGPLLVQNGGTLIVGDSAALGTAAGGTTIAGTSSIQLNAGVSVASEPLSIAGWGSFGVIRFTSAGASWGGPITLDNTNPAFGSPGERPNRYVRLGSSTGGGGTLTLSGPILGGNTTDLFRGSSGFGPTLAVRVANGATDVVVLSGASSFAGDFSVINGRVVLSGGDDRLPSTARYLGSWPGATFGTLDLNGNSQTFSGISDWDSTGGTGEVTNTSGTASVLTIDTEDTQASIEATRDPLIHTSPFPTPTFTGVIGGNLSFVKQGSGDTTLAGANTYTGSTTVNAGNLTLKQAVLADGADVRLNGGKLVLDFAATDTVRSLYINGVQQTAGVYGSTLSGAANVQDTYLGGTGTLTVTEGPSDPFGAWATSYGLTGPSALADADPDADGIGNFLEWILGRLPNAADSSASAVGITADATNLYVSFNREDASEPVATLTVQWGGVFPLSGSTTVGAAGSGPDVNGISVTVTENGSAPDAVLVTIPRTNAVSGRLFARLQAVQN